MGFMSPEAFERLLKDAGLRSVDDVKNRIVAGKKPRKQRLSDLRLDLIVNTERLLSENVLCYIPGSEPELQEELLVITAHYDHIGMNAEGVFNGADDDGSGTVAVLEMARAFKMAADEGNGPRRSVLLMTVSGEEKGLLGSEWYVSSPVFPLKNTVANLNVDMIGRMDDRHDDPNYIYIIGSDRLSSDLHRISERANQHYTGIELDYTYNDPDDPNRFYYRSDHYNFAKNNIPVIFYFSGVHEDYHGLGDTADKIMYDKMETVSRLIFFTAWEILNADQRPQLDVEP
jgi:Zn-dependent M28 family amino/carboxypeptidase